MERHIHAFVHVALIAVALLVAGGVHADQLVIDLGRGPVTVHYPAGNDADHPAPLLVLLHGFTGMLVHSVEGAAYQIRNLLTNPGLARRLGECGHDRVRDEFLITRHLKRYLLLFLALSNAQHPEVQVAQAGA